MSSNLRVGFLIRTALASASVGAAIVATVSTQGCSGASVQSLCAALVACEGSDQKTCEDSLNKTAASIPAACQETYQDYLHCTKSTAECTTNADGKKKYASWDANCYMVGKKLSSCKSYTVSSGSSGSSSSDPNSGSSTSSGTASSTSGSSK